jgi:hypothetical protein
VVALPGLDARGAQLEAGAFVNNPTSRNRGVALLLVSRLSLQGSTRRLRYSRPRNRHACYRPQGLAEKAKAGFHLFARPQDHAKLRRVLDRSFVSAQSFPSITRWKLHRRAACRAAVASLCFRASHQRKNSPRLRTNWHMNFCIAGIVAVLLPGESGRLRPKRLRVGGERLYPAVERRCTTLDRESCLYPAGGLADARGAHRRVSVAMPLAVNFKISFLLSQPSPSFTHRRHTPPEGFRRSITRNRPQIYQPTYVSVASGPEAGPVQEPTEFSDRPIEVTYPQTFSAATRTGRLVGLALLHAQNFKCAAGRSGAIQAKQIRIVCEFACGSMLYSRYDISDCPPIDLLVISGGWGTRKLLEDEELLTWIKKAASNAATVMFVCSGSLLFARAGLLCDQTKRP